MLRSNKIKRRIDAQADFNQVWNQIALLKSQKSLEGILKKAIQNQFYGINLKLIRKGRQINKENKEGMPERFIEKDDIKECAPKVATSIKQAYEYYRAAKEAGLLTKPVLLYYGMVSLSKALVDSTYIVQMPKKHGLKIEFKNGKPLQRVIVERSGAFQTFRDTYISDTSIYTCKENTMKFKLKDLLAVIPGIANEWMITYYGWPSSTESKNFPTKGIDDSYTNELRDVSGKYRFKVYRDLRDLEEKNKFNAHVIDAHFMAMYILCTLARYYPSHWVDLIENSKKAFVINTFLTRSELDFPILIYNEITGIETNFLPFARMV